MTISQSLVIAILIIFEFIRTALERIAITGF